jgi:excisionase family DNA binding protein
MVCYRAKGLEGDAGMSVHLLTTLEAADILRCSEWTIRRRAKKGLLQYVRPYGTKRMLFKEEYILDLATKTNNMSANTQ